MGSRTNKSMAMAFKKSFHQGRPANFLVVGKDGSGNNVVREFRGTLNQHWQALSDLNEKGFNIFMLVNTVSGKKRTADQVTKVNALFVDYDGGHWSADDNNIVAFLDKFPVKPHMAVETSPGCFHVYWLVNDVPLDQFSSVQKKLAAKFDSDPKVCDPPRVMRVPGTTNWKREIPFLAKTIYKNDDAEAMSYSQFASEMFGKEEPVISDVSTQSTVVVATQKSGENDDLASRAIHAMQKIPADDRKVWTTVGMALKSAFGEAGLQMFKDWSSGSPKYDEQELERQWRSFRCEGGINIGTVFWLANSLSNQVIFDDNMPKAANLLSLGEHFAQASKAYLRYCEAENSFYACINGKWVRSNKIAERVAINYLQNLNAAAARIKNDELRNFINRNQTLGSARELLRSAESDPVLKVVSSAFDSAPHLLAVKRRAIPDTVERHAVIDLRKNKKKCAEPEDMILRIAGAEYDSNAKCPRWMTFIDEVTEGDSNLAEFLQQVAGYTLYGHTREQVLFIFIGGAGNGKGVFARTIFKLLGDYSVAMQSSLLKPGAINANSPSPALMKLMGKRVWLCSEVPKGMVLDEALVKQITGGDIVSSRQLYGDQVEFLPVGKLWFLVNDMPRVRHDDKGMWRRIVPIPFNANFTGKNRDNDLEENLATELPGILNWALEGAYKYAKSKKLILPSASEKLLSVLRRDVDTVGLWIKSRCVVTDEGKLQAKVAYDDYCETLKREKATYLPQKEFKADLERRGFAHKTGNKFNYYRGLTIKG